VGTGWLGFNPTAVSVQNWPSSQFTLDANPGIYDRFYNYVYKYDPEDSNPFRLEWKYQVNGDTEVVPMNNTEHKIFLLLAEPQTPWDAINKPPWVEVLDDACDWANRQRTPEGVATVVTQGMYENTTLVYETKKGRHGYAGTENGDDFNLTDFVTDIHDTVATHTYACYDTGQAVVIYSGAVGVAMNYKYIDSFGHVNCIKPINGVWTNNPFYDRDNTPPIMGEDVAQNRTFFYDHAFAEKNSLIYDACFKVDRDDNPDAGPPHIEAWLTGIEWDPYKLKVIDDVPSSSPGSPTTYTFGIR
jgi:hypothetical protein